MKDTTRQVIIELGSTFAAFVVELWRKVAKNEKKRGGKR